LPLNRYEVITEPNPPDKTLVRREELLLSVVLNYMATQELVSCEITSMKGSVTRRIGCECWSKLNGDVYGFGGARTIVMKSCAAKKKKGIISARDANL
jgi:hypothetical protein